MTIEELRRNHLSSTLKQHGWDKLVNDNTKTSVLFAIEELSDIWNDNTEYTRINLLERIKELKKYLNEH
jgi:hypothetical protein